MEGRVSSIDLDNNYGEIDTQNSTVNQLRFYPNSTKDFIKINDTVTFNVKTSMAGNRYAVNVKKVQRNICKFNTEDKEKWYLEGESIEYKFIAETVPQLGLDIIINPEKKEKPWVIDFYDRTNKRYADLKTQNTPFFTAKKYKHDGIAYDPAYTVTFNKKDYENYKQNYPGGDIYWNIEWTQLNYGH